MNEIVVLFRTGGVFMYPLAVLSVVILAIIVERFVTEYGWRKWVISYVQYLRDGKLASGFKISDNDKMPDHFFSSPDSEKEDLVSEKIQTILDRRSAVNEVITAIGNTAPLLGFIGTISGMINSFSAIANADKVSIKLVATGISEALITTGYGLIIAVICIISEALLRFWFVKFSHRLEEIINVVFDF